MTGTNDGLHRLHQLLQQLRDVETQLDRGPRQIQARERLVVKAEELLEEKREALKQAKAKTDRKSLDLKTNEAKMAELQTKLNVSSSNREYDLIRGHMEADTVANSVLEDEILEALELVDRMQIEVGQADQQAKDALAEKERCAEQVTAAESGLRAQAEELSSQVREAEKVLSGDVALQYRRLLEAYGADALASVDGRICTNCYVAITPQARVELNSGKIKFCECGRLLYPSREE